jgi:hypothetical protein
MTTVLDASCIDDGDTSCKRRNIFGLIIFRGVDLYNFGVGYGICGKLIFRRRYDARFSIF